MTGIKALVLVGPTFEPATLDAVLALPVQRLQVMNLDLEPHLDALAANTALEELAGAIPPAGLAALVGAPLKSLQVNDATGADLSGFSALESFTTYDIDDAAFASLASCSALKVLKTPNAPTVTEASVTAVLTALTNLTEVDLASNETYGGAVVLAAAKLPALTSLELYSVAVDAGTLAPLAVSPALTSLVLNIVGDAPPEAFAPLAATSLTSLELRGDSVPLDLLAMVAESATLTSVSLSSALEVADEAALVEAVGKLAGRGVAVGLTTSDGRQALSMDTRLSIYEQHPGFRLADDGISDAGVAKLLAKRAA